MPASLSNRTRLAAALLIGLAASGCADRPEIDRPGTWKPTGANDRNLRAMIADPNDLAGGVGALTSRGNGASRAVTRLYTDRRRPLIDASLSKIAPAASESGDSGGAPAAPSGGTAPAAAP